MHRWARLYLRRRHYPQVKDGVLVKYFALVQYVLVYYSRESPVLTSAQLLQTVNVAQVYSDPKTFVDKPTSKSSQQVLADFSNFNLSTVTEGQIVNFVDSDFLGEGLELEAAALTNFNPTPAFLNNVTDPLSKAFAQTVHGYWTQLARNTNQSAICDEYPGGTCESSLIPLNHTFIIPGGRFREQCLCFSVSLLRWISMNMVAFDRLLGQLLDYSGSDSVRII